MRLLLANQFYPPDSAPTGQLLRDLARHLAARGHDIDVLSSNARYDGGAPCADMPVAGVRVLRLTGPHPAGGMGAKTSAAAAFLAGAWAHATRMRGRYDAAVALTSPPFLAAAIRAADPALPLLHWIMDLYPDALLAHGALRHGSVAAAAAAAIARWAASGRCGAVALGETMAQAATARLGVPASTIPLWAEAGVSPWPSDRPVPLRRDRGWDDGGTVLLYSGNLGRGHRHREFLAAAAMLGPQGPRWAFAGGGARRSEVAEFAAAHPEARISLHGYAPRERLNEHLASGDVHLASLDPAWDGCMVPSKLIGSFAAARPVIFVGSAISEPARWIAESGGGWVVPCDDPAALAAAARAACDPAERTRRGAAAAAYAAIHFDRTRNLGRMTAAVESLA